MKRIILGIAIFLVALFVPLNLPVLFILSYLVVGYDVLINSVKNILKGKVFDELFLMSIATIGAFVIGKYHEAVAVMTFYQIGEMFCKMAEDKSKNSIVDLMNLKPDMARVKRDNKFEEVEPANVKSGDIILVKPGEKIPLDGKVIQGRSFIDTSMLTGESVPREIKTGEDVFSGTINQTGAIEIEVTQEYENSTVSKILDLVENASNKKAPTERFITKFAKYYTPVVILLALFIMIIPPLLKVSTLSESVYRALVFLVVSCPCALVVSVPLGFFGGIGSAAKHGILVKGGNSLEELTKIDTVIFDKTGTLTEGIFEVSDIYPKENKEEILKTAVYAENYSLHPIAGSLKRAYSNEILEEEINDVEEIAGYGVNACIYGKKVSVGNEKLMERLNIEYHIPDNAGTIVQVAKDNKYLGCITISDKLKDDAKHVIEELKKMWVNKIVMLTGDNRKIADVIAKQLNIDEVRSDLLPQDKINEVEKLKEKNHKVMFVGDGINDAPSLISADAGIAMGGLGSDAAIEAADIVIMGDELSKIITILKISDNTLKIVKQNTVMILFVKLVVLLLGAVGLIGMWGAVFADVGILVAAILNSMRTLSKNFINSDCD